LKTQNISLTLSQPIYEH